MTDRRPLLAALALLPLLACAEAAPPGDPGADRAEAGLAFGGHAIVVEGTGHWTRVLACSGFCISEYNAWVDLAVRNDAFDKDVAILYTTDGWASSHTAHATYEGPLADGYERWGVDLTFGTGPSRPVSEVELAAYVVMGGQTWWEPYNNHHIYAKVTAEAPVRRLHSEVSWTPEGGLALTGAVRVFNLAYEKAVTVRYTTDGWATWEEAPAAWSQGNDWTFAATGLAADDLPAEVAFAVRYDVAGQAFWDNHAGANYRHQVAPRFVPGTLPTGPDGRVSGVVTYHGVFETELPLAAIQGRLDGGKWTNGASMTFSTAGLQDGPHVLELRAVLEGGWVSPVRAVPFEDRDRIVALDTWRLPPPAGLPPSPGAWGLDQDAAGRLYVMWDQGVLARYDAWGAAAPSLVFDPPPSGAYTFNLAVDADGTAYAVVPWSGKALVRWLPDGTLDTSFGVDGKVDLEAPIDGVTPCNYAALEVADGVLYALDSCAERVVRVATDGTVLDATPLGAWISWSVPTALQAAPDGLHVLASRDHLVVTWGEAGATVTATALPEIGSPQGVHVADDGTAWVAGGSDRLVALSPSGEVLARWYGGGGNGLGLLGGFHLPQAVVARPDGSLAVLGAQNAWVARFEGALAE